MLRQTILVVDDETAIRDMVKMALEIAGYNCLEASSARAAIELVVDQCPDLILLDWMMPEISGIEFLRRLKRDEQTAEIPVIMLTAKDEELSKVGGLDAGADDYITKPFIPRELLARINAVLRRSDISVGKNVLTVNDLTLDLEAQRVLLKGHNTTIGPTEYKLLKFFMLHPERAYTRSQLLDQVWGGSVYIEERTVDVHIRRLRKILQSNTADCSQYIQTVRGTGYRFSVSPN